jgi:hypothetical protein
MYLSKIILFTGLLFANLAWLLNPHACCPREPLNTGLIEHECCSMNHSQNTVDKKGHALQGMPSQKAAGPFFNQESQLSKGVMLSVPDVTSGSNSLYQPSQNRITYEIRLNENLIPDSVILPLHKKPPRIQSA